MKKLVVVYAVAVALAVAARAMASEVDLKNGRVLNGTVSRDDKLFKDYVQVKASDGKVYMISLDDIEQIDGVPVQGSPTTLKKIKSPASFAKKDYYLALGLGLSKVVYPSIMKPAIDSLSQPPQPVSDISMDSDAGLYFPVSVGGNQLWGFDFRFDNDQIQNSTGFWTRLDQYLFSFSWISFASKQIGDGFFIRADGGIALANFDNNIKVLTVRRSGLGLLLGVGVPFPITDDWRLIVYGDYSLRFIGIDYYHNFDLSAGVMF